MGEAVTALKIPSDLYQGTEAEEQLCAFSLVFNL